MPDLSTSSLSLSASFAASLPSHSSPELLPTRLALAESAFVLASHALRSDSLLGSEMTNNYADSNSPKLSPSPHRRNPRQRGKVVYFKDGKWVKRCAHCDTQFNTPAKQSLYCSSVCRRKSEAIAKGISAWINSRLVTHCANEKCGNDFTPVNRQHRFCSPKCRSAHWRTQGALAASKKCAECRKPFLPVRISHRYCSNKCRRDAHRKLTAEQNGANS